MDQFSVARGIEGDKEVKEYVEIWTKDYKVSHIYISFRTRSFKGAEKIYNIFNQNLTPQMKGKFSHINMNPVPSAYISSNRWTYSPSSGRTDYYAIEYKNKDFDICTLKTDDIYTISYAHNVSY